MVLYLPEMKLVTLLFLRREDWILLAMKKRGFGAGKWNGVGGKAAPGETARQAIIRECQEEIGVTPGSLRLVGKILFLASDDPTFGHDARIFVADNWEGEPIETEEMRPAWFQTNQIPYDTMWSDDQYWLPALLKGKSFKATITLNLTTDALVSHDITFPDKLEETD